MRSTLESGSLLIKLQETVPERRRDLLVQFIEDQTLKILRWDEGRRNELSHGFAAIGFDSLMAVELQFNLQTALRFAGDADEFEQPSVEALADHLLQHRVALS